MGVGRASVVSFSLEKSPVDILPSTMQVPGSLNSSEEALEGPLSHRTPTPPHHKIRRANDALHARCGRSRFERGCYAVHCISTGTILGPGLAFTNTWLRSLQRCRSRKSISPSLAIGSWYVRQEHMAGLPSRLRTVFTKDTVQKVVRLPCEFSDLDMILDISLRGSPNSVQAEILVVLCCVQLLAESDISDAPSHVDCPT